MKRINEMLMPQLVKALPLVSCSAVSSENSTLLCGDLPPWESHRYQPISLWVILKTYAHSFAEVARLLTEHVSSLLLLMPQGGRIDQVPDSTRSWVSEDLDKVSILCQDLGLRGTQAYIRKFKNRRVWLYVSLRTALLGVRERMEEELSEIYFLHIPAEKVRYYDSAFFGEEVEERFPSTCDDMHEAGNCFALCRWTAVVHHCMGIVQSGLLVVGQHLKMKNPIDVQIDDWNAIITKIEGAVLQKGKSVVTPQAKSDWKKVEPLYIEMISDVRAMKNAWRNPTAHFRRIYNEEQAEKVLGRVKDFMRNLAMGLQLREQRQRRRSPLP